MSNELNFIIEDSQSEERLDKLLLELLATYQLSRSRIQKLIKDGQVSVNGKASERSSEKLKAEDQLIVDLASLDNKKEIKPFETEYQIAYEDDYLIVIDKPAGLTVHPGAGNLHETLANALYLHLSYAPFMVHRLDKDTSGLIVVAKNELTQRKLIEQFQSRSIKREYLALCLVTPRSNRRLQTEAQGKIETLIGRDPKNRLLMSVINEESRGKVAITNWDVQQVYSYGLLVKFKLETGRTHQIRVHANHLGSPIIGDPVYGDFSLLPKDLYQVHSSLGRQFLHAVSLSFIHPKDQKEMSFSSELPSELVECQAPFKMLNLA